MAIAENTTTGGCFCGEVSFEITEEPDRRVQCFCRTGWYFSKGSPRPFIIVPGQYFKEELKIQPDFKKFSYKGDSGNTVIKKNISELLYGSFSKVEAGKSIAISLGTLHVPSRYSTAASIWI